MLPVLLNIYSPLLMSWGFRNGLVTSAILVFTVWFILSLFMGRSASCGYTCPYGALQEIIGLHIFKKKPESEKAGKIRYIAFIFFSVMVSFAFLKVGGFKGVNLFAANGSAQLIVLTIIFILGLVILSVIFGSRAFCRYICPQGVFLSIGSILGRKVKIPSLNLKSNKEKCTDCKLCNMFCPMGLYVSHMVSSDSMDNLNCILCGECIEKCPKDAINYSFKP